MEHVTHFLSLSLLPSQTNRNKKKLYLSTVVPPCIGWLGSCEAICNTSQSPCWGESGRHGRSRDMGQIPTVVFKLIKSIWDWGMSIMGCRSITSMMFCRSRAEAASGSWGVGRCHLRLPSVSSLWNHSKRESCGCPGTSEYHQSWW